MSVEVDGEKPIFGVDAEILDLFADVLVLEVLVHHVVEEGVLDVLDDHSFTVSEFLESGS